MQTKINMRVTMDDVAIRAGVSKGTVFRVLNQAPNVSTANINAVHAAATLVGYPMGELRKRRISRAKSGVVNHTRRIALVLIGNRNLKWIQDNGPVYSYVIHGVEQLLAERGVELTIACLASCSDAIKLVRQSRIEGLIFFGWESKDSCRYEPLPVPAVWAMGEPVHFTGDHFLPDNIRIGILAAQYLAGHRCAAFLGSSVYRPSADGVARPYRGAAFLDMRRKIGLETLQLIDQDLMQSNTNLPDESRMAALIERFASADPRPTGLFVEMDPYSPSVYRQLIQHGVKPGQDVQIVTCNNERPWVAGLHPTPAIIDIHADQIGRRAAERLLFRIENPQALPEQTLVRPTLLEPPPRRRVSAPDVSPARPSRNDSSSDYAAELPTDPRDRSPPSPSFKTS